MLYAIAAVIALIIDQAVKYWTTVNIVVDTGEARLIPGFVHLANLHNTGAAFSFLEGARWFFVALCIVFCLVVIYVLAKNIISQPLARWMAVLVMAGAIGNCIDRIVCGYVVDMFEFDFLIFGKPFPVFNVADIYITVGVIVFCICILLEKPAAKRTNVPFSEGQAAAEEKPARVRPPRRRRTPIPDFPKHAPVEEPAMDPSDPFAEWERKRAANAQPTRNYSREAVDFVKILAEEPVATALDAPPRSAEPKAAPAGMGFEPAPAASAAPAVQSAAPAAPAGSETPAVTEPAPVAREQNETEYNLDDILAEFRDL